MSQPGNAAPSRALVFQSTTFHPIDRDGQPWLTAAEISHALGYSRADAIGRIFERNRAEFTPSMSLTVNLTVRGSVAPKPVRIFSLRGAHLVAMFARTPKAAEFRRWVLDVLDREAGAPQAQPNSAGLPFYRDQAVQMSMRYMSALEQHATDPSKHPRPRWDEARASEIAEGMVGSWILQDNRWLLTFDHNGKPVLRMLERDACVMSVDRLLDEISKPGGLHVAPDKLYRFVVAAMARLEQNRQHLQDRAAGGPGKPYW